jgi:hypothetical protein
MHDEACTHYEDMINNMKVGHDFLRKEFDGYAPTIGWHVDPFGHSTFNPRLFADLGFNSWFFWRLDYEDQALREEEKRLEFVWRPQSDTFGSSKDIFTHIL